jgi:hypothetical protein
MKAKVHFDLIIVCLTLSLTLVACSQVTAPTEAPTASATALTEVEATSVPTEIPTEKPPTPSPVPPTETPAPPTPTEKPFPDRNYPEVIIADFEARPRTWLEKMDWFKEIGVTTIIIHFAYLREWGPEHRLAYPPTMTGEYELVYPHPPAGPPSEEYVRQLIVTAREEGFAVILGPMVGRIGDPSPIEQIDDWERFKADSIAISVRWAAIAEELEVEYYMPFCELVAVLEVQKDPDQPGEPKYSFEEVMALIAEWDNEAIPQIRSVFSGKLINHIYCCGILSYPVSGYDIIGLGYKYHAIYEGYIEFPNFLVEAQTLAQREGIDWMVIEMHVHLRAEDNGRDPLEIEAELWSLAAQEYLRADIVPPVGFGTSFDVTDDEGEITRGEGTPSEVVFREFFAALKQAR